MKKLFALPACLLVASTVAGCTVMDVVGPRPNAEIVALARQAAADEAAGSELRGAQKQALVNEALRLCGTTPQGETPSSCSVELGELPAAADTGSLVAMTAEAAKRVPEDSVDLVVAQAIDAAAAGGVDLEDAHPGASELDAADPADAASQKDILEREYAFQYGLGVAKAFGDDALADRIVELDRASKERVAALVESVDRDTPETVAAPGYLIGDAEQPTDEASAAALVEHLRQNLVDEWRHTAAAANDPVWREAAIWLAAHAQRS